MSWASRRSPATTSPWTRRLRRTTGSNGRKRARSRSSSSRERRLARTTGRRGSARRSPPVRDEGTVSTPSRRATARPIRSEASSRSNGGVVMTERVLAGRYRLVRVIGQGGMAVVHLAHDELLDRDVAVKVLRPGFDEDPEFIDRFRREARHAASLHHPNIVTIFDTGKDPESNSDYIVMQLVDGPDLQQILERSGRVSVGFAVRIGIETALALAFAHEHDIIHRDIKPGNILIDSDDHVHVADFGIARAATDTGVTTGGMIGSPQYASPEQVVGETVGPASDLYSLGVVLYEALTGVRPFDGPTPASVALERLRVAPRPIRAIDPSLPRSLEQIVMRLLEQRPEARPSSAAEVAAELDGFRVRELGGVRQQGSRPRGRGAAAVAAVGTLSAAAAPPGPAIVSRRRPRRGPRLRRGRPTPRAPRRDPA